MPAPRRSGPWAAVRAIWQRNQDLLRNASSIFVTSGLTSLFGFVFWVAAAREFSQQAVGYGAAAVSAMGLFGAIGEFGLGTMLIGELPKRRGAGGLIVASIIASGVGSLVLGVAFPLVADAFGAHFPQISGTLAGISLFALGVALTGMTMVFDEATLGLMRGGVQLSRNLAMSVIKLALLPITAFLLHDAFGMGLILAWVVGILLSLIPAIFMLKRGGSRISHRPDWALLRKLGKLAAAHNWLNLAIMGPSRLIPVLVIVVVSPAANAAFYVAWMLVGILFMVPRSLSIMLFAVASAAPDVIAEKLRFVLRISIMIGLPAMAVLALCAPLILRTFGANYARLGTISLLLLIVTYIPKLARTQYVAVCRATHRVGHAAIVLSVAGLCEVGAVVAGGKISGLNGVAAGYLIIQMVEGLVTAPTVLRAAFVKQPAASVATDARPKVEHSYLERQHMGLAALIALASAPLMEGHSLDVATEIWRTGSFKAVTGSFPVLREDHEESYGTRQRAGMDVLLGMATQVAPDGARLQVARADPAEVQRLRALHRVPRGQHNRHTRLSDQAAFINTEQEGTSDNADKPQP